MSLKNKTLLLLCAWVLTLQTGYAQVQPLIQYPLENDRLVGDIGSGDVTIANSRTTSGHSRRDLGKSVREQWDDLTDAFQNRKGNSLVSFKRRPLQHKYQMIEMNHSDSYYTEHNWAGYLFQQGTDTITGYVLVEPVFIQFPDNPTDTFDNEPFFQQVYQQPQVPDWLNLQLPEGYTFSFYQVPQTAEYIEIYGILEAPYGYKAMALEAFFPEVLSPQLKPWMQQHLNAVIQDTQSYLNEFYAP